MSIHRTWNTLHNSPSHRSYLFSIIKALLLVLYFVSLEDLVCGYCGIEEPLIVVGLCIATDIVHWIRNRRRGLDPPWRWQRMVAVYVLMVLVVVGLWMIVR